MNFVNYNKDEVDARSFVERFINFEDGLVKEVLVRLSVPPAGEPNMTLEIEAMDSTKKNRENRRGRLYEWRRVRLTIGSLIEYKLMQRERFFNPVLSDGLQLHLIDDRWILDCDPGPDKWSIERLVNSEQYAIGLSCQYAVL